MSMPCIRQGMESGTEAGRVDPLSREGFQSLMQLKYMRYAPPKTSLRDCAQRCPGLPAHQGCTTFTVSEW